MWISLVPLLFGGGTALFADVEEREALQVTEVIDSPQVPHLRYETTTAQTGR